MEKRYESTPNTIRNDSKLVAIARRGYLPIVFTIDDTTKPIFATHKQTPTHNSV